MTFSAISGAPPPDVVVPPELLDLAAGEPIRPVWLNEVGTIGCRSTPARSPGRCRTGSRASGRSVLPSRVLQRLDRLGTPPTVDRLVVCQGDACAPNTMLGDDGELSGHVDLGELGVADRWADLAVATWSTHWNYGPGWDSVLLEAYGIDPDPERTRYFRALWSAED